VKEVIIKDSFTLNLLKVVIGGRPDMDSRRPLVEAAAKV